MSPVELQPAGPLVTGVVAGLALAAVAALLALSAVPLAPAAAAWLLGAGALLRTRYRGAGVRFLRSPLPGQWCVVSRDGVPRTVRLLRAWALGGWLAAACFALPDGGRLTLTLLCRDQAPGAWRRFLVRLRTT